MTLLALRRRCRQIERWGKRLTIVNIYFDFDNDQPGFAAQNALRLKRMVTGRQTPAGGLPCLSP